jgi:protoporphyrinogen oxidase
VILVLGGGISGLAAARTIAGAKVPYLVLEREEAPGGWCRSMSVGGYTFDMSGHFLHLSDPRMKEWVLGLGNTPWRTVHRDARVFLRRTVTPFPFQANLHGYPRGLVRRCLADFAAERIREAMGRGSRPGNFAEWLLRRFGRTMCREFFFPYNRKMWRRSLRSMGYSWTDWSVPVPSFDELLAGARGESLQGMGYNPTFLYPETGGIGAMVDDLARGVLGRTRLRAEVARVDLARKRAWSRDGEEFRFDAVVSTVPLPALARMCDSLPPAVREAANALKWVKVLAVNLGVRAPASTLGHWVYVPEKSYPFFRVGFLSNVSPSAAPRGCASLFVERSFPSGVRVNVGEEVRLALSGLRRMGILRGGQRPEQIRPVMLDPAYVLFDHSREKAVTTLTGHFRRRAVFPAGRYGAWEYNGMGASMADGIRAAKEALRRIGCGRR